MTAIVTNESMTAIVPIAFINECFHASKNRLEVKSFDYSTLKTEINKENVTGIHAYINRDAKAVDSVLDIMKQSPLVKLSRLTAKYDISCNVYGKYEALLGGGSIKDRIAHEMITTAEAAGAIKPGDVIVEATSGNAGLGLATVCAVKGYQMVVFMPEKMSKEKEKTLQALGAVVFRTPDSARWYCANSCTSTARKFEAEVNSRTAETGRRALFVDQYRNSGNLSAHYHGTAEEILKQLDNRVDAVVVGCGTGGTMTGLATRLRETVPDCKVYGVDPKGSLLHLRASEIHDCSFCPWNVEGIGKDFHPSTFQPELIDEWFIEDDHSTFNCARDLIRTEGMLVGGSSGAALSAAIKVAKRMGAGENLVIIFPDSVRNYISTFLSDDWMLLKGYISPTSHPLANATAEFSAISIKEATSALTLRPFSSLPRYPSSLTVRHLYFQMQPGLHCIVYDAVSNVVCGLLSKNDLTPHVLDDKLDKPLSSIAAQTLLVLSEDSSLQKVWIVMDAACEARKSRSAAVVLSRKTRPESDLVKALADFQTSEEDGSVILTQEQLADIVLTRRSIQ